MVRIEDECCGCATDSYPCIGSACPNRNVKRFYCDKCGDEATLYYWSGNELCIDCIEKDLEVVDGSKEWL